MNNDYPSFVTIDPRDVLYFRDARPVAPGTPEDGNAGGAGSGANWPLPHLFHSAILSAFYERWPKIVEEFESKHVHRTLDDRNWERSRMRFGAVRALGVFPAVVNGGAIGPQDIYVPTPADVLPGPAGKPAVMAPMQGVKGATNLPEPLRYPVASTAPPSKAELGRWISLQELNRYLQGQSNFKTESNDRFFCSESRPGVAIDPKTHANKEHQFYQTDYLRLKPGVRLAGWLDARSVTYEREQEINLLDKYFAEAPIRPIIIGGQRGTGWLEYHRENKPAIDWGMPQGRCIKWVLLTPACFNAGWLPGWVSTDPTSRGKVMLGISDRKRRRLERQNIPVPPCVSEYNVKLVAARIGKPIVYSGWKLASNCDNAGGAPKATRLFVPAGSVYYFEAETEEGAKALFKALHLQCKSDILGEKGYGFGVCGSWDFIEF